MPTPPLFTPSADVQSLLGCADVPAMKTLLEIGGGGAASNEVRHDFVEPYIYTGLAPADSLESASVWLIRRATTNSAGSITLTESAAGEAWDDRLTAIYI